MMNIVINCRYFTTHECSSLKLNFAIRAYMTKKFFSQTYTCNVGGTYLCLFYRNMCFFIIENNLFALVSP